MSAFAKFRKIENSDRFKMVCVISSPYETESLTEDTMCRKLSSFLENSSILSIFRDQELEQLLSFGTDNSVTLHPSITLVEYQNNQDDDPINGLNKIKVTCDGKVLEMLSSSSTGSYFKNLYPNGYTAGGY